MAGEIQHKEDLYQAIRELNRTCIQHKDGVYLALHKLNWAYLRFPWYCEDCHDSRLAAWDFCGVRYWVMYLVGEGLKPSPTNG